jgi:hypothetical protein
MILVCQALAQNPLAGLPSAPGAHVAQIEALGDNEWLNLGSPAADPQWGKGRGRSWGGYMAYAADLEGAFLAGQGKHGYIKPDGRYDDIFFYDVNANQWTCIFPGVNSNTFVSDINAGNLKMRDDGQLTDRDGQPVPLSYNGHSYKSYTYAAGLRRWVTVICASGIGGDQYSASMQWYIDGSALLSAQMAGKTDSASGTPFFYNVESGEFERFHFNPLSSGAQGRANVFYLESKQKLWYYDGPAATLRLGDFTTRRWTSAGASGTGPSGIDVGGCYDGKRDRIYLGASGYGPSGQQDKVFIYDVASNAWSSASIGRTFTTSNYGAVLYDSINDRVLEVNRDPVTVRVFDPETWALEATLTAPAGVANPSACWHAFYSPALNAHFIYQAGDSDDRGVMWAYRYKRGNTKREAKAKAEVKGSLCVSPNPFKSMVTINVRGQKPASTRQSRRGGPEARGQKVVIRVCDVTGQTVFHLASGLWSLASGITWNASALPAGVYIAQVAMNGRTFSKRMILIK